MSTLLERLKPKERRGSKPRCHLLTHGSPDDVAARLTALVAPFASAVPSDCWMPQGFENTAEATLPEAERLLPADVRLELQRWWLSVASNNTRTPNWDLASTCTIEGKAGIMLIEAKAHDQELIKEETGRKNIEAPVSGSARRNLLRIDWAIRDASLALTESTGLTWALSRDWNYQMSNRFAWAWKLADLGIPVVLVYLGFLGTSEMKDQGNPLADAADWEAIVKRHSQALFPAEVWGRRWTCGGHPFIPLIRSLAVPLNVNDQFKLFTESPLFAEDVFERAKRLIETYGAEAPVIAALRSSDDLHDKQEKTWWIEVVRACKFILNGGGDPVH